MPISQSLLDELSSNSVTSCCLDKQFVDQLTEKDVPILKELLLKRSIKKLELEDIPIKEGITYQLIALINDLPIEDFSLTSSVLNEDFVEKLIAVLKKPHKLRNLSFGGNLDDNAVDKITPILNQASLESFTLKCRDISDKTAFNFAKKLAENTFFVKCNTAGFLYCSNKKDYAAITYANNFLKEVMARNQQMQNTHVLHKKFQFYNEFAIRFNESLLDKASFISKNNLRISALKNYPFKGIDFFCKVPRLEDLCKFQLQVNRNQLPYYIDEGFSVNSDENKDFLTTIKLK